MTEYLRRTPLTRRTFLAATMIGGLALTACGRTGDDAASNRSAPTVDTAALEAAEAARPHTGRTVTAALRPQTAEIDLGGITARTLAYGDTVPGPLIRANVGDGLGITVANGLDHPTSIHWHGIALRNDMDGAAPASPDIGPGKDFTYRFSVPHPGTYWAHPHTGLDTDYGLYMPVIVDDPTEPGRYDAEWIVVVDDWTDGVGKSPQQILDGLRASGSGMPSSGMGHGGMPGMGGVGSSALLGGDAGDIAYPHYLINGRIPAAPSTFKATPGQRIRIRISNAGADTAFRVALAGHPMTVTHTDGFPIQPTVVDALLLGMGERYDVTVTAGDGVFPLVALAEGKNRIARALLSTGSGSAPDPGLRPTELSGRVGTVDSFTATTEAALPQTKPDVTLAANLTGGMMRYDWAIGNRAYPDNTPLTVTQGQRARLTFTNKTMMWHPMHLHGHTFQVVKPDGTPGPRKDTVIVLPMSNVRVDLIADNPGDWMLHCHNGYHMDVGMMTRLDYRA
ncbi:multicopper oxidase family protein [Nocardia sp. NPDC049149]|uniref:multicopper oxidase family protein n=1 Tax=Nocardia sp. NPDC049149 TaxID=3364315 RepID=UPI0037141BE8